ncbi:MAG: prepilin peptidase, partial [Patescibacteria group bacterium]
MIVGILIVLGLCFGSFVNALVWRVYQQSLPKAKRPKKVDLSIQKGRSVCPNCHHVLGWQDLLPVISWLGLRGKCRYCSKPILWQYPLVEILTAVIFVISYLFWPFEFTGTEVVIFGLWLAVVVNLVALAVYDVKWMLLPNRLVKFALGFAVVLSWITISARSGEIYVDLAKL